MPLWLGGAPSSSSPLSLPFSLRGSNACIRNVLLDNVILDLEGFVDEENSQNGCPQVERERKEYSDNINNYRLIIHAMVSPVVMVHVSVNGIAIIVSAHNE